MGLALLGFLLLFAAGFAFLAIMAGIGIARALQRPRRKTFGVALAWGLPTDPAQFSPDFTELTYRFRDGSETVVWDVPGKDPAGPIVVFVHGHADSRFGALTWLPYFHDMTSRTLVYDLRAHGDSSAKRMQGAMGEADDLLELIRGLLPGEQVVVYGASMGAGIAVVAAARDYEKQIKGVVADSVYRHRMEPVESSVRLRGFPPQPFVAVAHALLKLTGQAPGPFDRVHHARKIACPLLVLHGRDDEVIAPESAEAVAEAAPQSTFHVFDDAGHVSSAAIHFEKYRSILADFFRKVQAGETAVTAGEDDGAESASSDETSSNGSVA